MESFFLNKNRYDINILCFVEKNNCYTHRPYTTMRSMVKHNIFVDIYINFTGDDRLRLVIIDVC